RARFDTNLERLLALSRAALPARPELVVWPESAFESAGDADGHPFLGAIANQLGVPLLAGLRRPVPGGPPGVRWNSAALALPGGRSGSAAARRSARVRARGRRRGASGARGQRFAAGRTRGREAEAGRCHQPDRPGGGRLDAGPFVSMPLQGASWFMTPKLAWR